MTPLYTTDRDGSVVERGTEALVWYNEIDPFAAQVMRELIAEGVIAPGVVDERDIRDIAPMELVRFRQCHFFAGGGVWSYALRRAGWPDDRPIWTGSCPCQPFSTAGKGLGFDDERHLWPSWDWLIDQCRPECIVGEQVADKGADAWLDLVQADVEGMGYAFGCVPLASAGFGAPNPRHRSFWLAHADQDGCREARHSRISAGDVGPIRDGAVIRLADAMRAGRPERRTVAGDGQATGCGGASDGDPGPANGFWRDADWLYCRDPGGPRWRPVNSGTFPLAPGFAGRVGALRVSGNAINAEVATGFIEAVMDVLDEGSMAA